MSFHLALAIASAFGLAGLAIEERCGAPPRVLARALFIVACAGGCLGHGS